MGGGRGMRSQGLMTGQVGRAGGRGGGQGGSGSDFVPVPKERRAQTVRRIARFFRPYRGRVAVVLLSIIVTSFLGLVNPYLLKALLDVAIPQKDQALLNLYVGLMILVPIVSGLIGIGQTYLNNVVGQHVMQDLRNALYAHLQTGSVRVRPGDVVTTGQVLGLLGNTGNSDAPHLHFHVMNGPVPLASQGLPYVFDRFTSAGRADLDDPGAMNGDPVKVDRGWNAGPAGDRLPLDNQVVAFD